ncbi:polysaccharide deacetylase [Methylocystis sp. S23]
MIAHLTPIERCTEVAGLAPHEIMLGVSPSEKHERLLAKYRSARRSRAAARARIVADIRAAVSSGATGEAADLLVVLRRLLAVDPSREPGRKGSAVSRRRAPAPRGRSASRALSARLASEAPKSSEAIVLRLPRERKPQGKSGEGWA